MINYSKIHELCLRILVSLQTWTDKSDEFVHITELSKSMATLFPLSNRICIDMQNVYMYNDNT